MADETRVAPEGLTTDDPELARAEIAMTRARMSETIDEIEDVLLRRKERIQDRLDLFSPVRERPLQFAGIVFGAGLLLGLLTGGGDDEDEDDEVLDVEFDFDPALHGSLAAAARADLWESRARRLMSLARAKEHPVRHEYLDDDFDDGEEWDDEDGSALEAAADAFHTLRDTVEERARPLISSLLRRVLPGNRGS